MENVKKSLKLKYKKTVVAHMHTSELLTGDQPTNDTGVNTILTTSVITVTHNR